MFSPVKDDKSYFLSKIPVFFAHILRSLSYEHETIKFFPVPSFKLLQHKKLDHISGYLGLDFLCFSQDALGS